ncbi:MAG: transcriptional regulator [Gemmatimonadetes bacterium]|nr:transcriptional regulator [Gemmatimonadota bacterium]
MLSAMSTQPVATRADATRRNLLDAAFGEFYRNGFQGGSLNRIVEAAGVTKGALFHHFAGKRELGYAVVDEVIEPLLRERWFSPLAGSVEPIAAMKQAFRRFIRMDVDGGSWVYGCPLNNLAQEMSPLDEGFRARIERLYTTWRQTFAAALAAGIAHGSVRSDIDTAQAATLIVAAQMGIWGTGKYSQDGALMTQAGEALCAYLDMLAA